MCLDNAALMIAEFLRHPIYGVAEGLPLMRIGVDGDRTAPGVKLIQCEVDKEASHWAGGELPYLESQFPALLVRVGQADDIEGATFVQAGENAEIVLPILYVTKRKDLALGTQHAFATFRAISRSLRKMHQPAHDQRRELNGVQINKIGRIALTGMRRPVGDSYITGALRVEIEARDTLIS